MKKIFIFLVIFIVVISCGKKNEIKNASFDDSTKVDAIDSLIDSIITKKLELNQPIMLDEIVMNDSVNSKKLSKTNNISKDYVKGLYLSAYTIVSKRSKTIIDSAYLAGINTIIFDLKNMNGDVFIDLPDSLDFLNHNEIRIVDIDKIVKKIHSYDMKAVARIVMFHDQYIAGNDFDMRPQNINGGVWVESKRKKPSWLDSSNPFVQNDLLKIIKLVAETSIDEIQMDYVRFPTQGNLSEAQFYFQKQDEINSYNDSLYIKRNKYDVIKEFVKRAHNICSKYQVKLTADVFAIVAWQRKIDYKNTGQKLELMTDYLDMIHPMIYPSHFVSNFNHRDNVENEPYQILYQGTKLTVKHSNKKCKVVPYIQAFNWKSNYKKEYLFAQIDAIKNSGGDGYILWNAQNRYLETLSWIIEKKKGD